MTKTILVVAVAMLLTAGVCAALLLRLLGPAA